MGVPLHHTDACFPDIAKKSPHVGMSDVRGFFCRGRF